MPALFVCYGQFLCRDIFRDIFNRNSLSCVGSVIFPFAFGQRYFEIAYKSVVNNNSLRSVLSRSLRFVNNDFVYQFFEQRCSQSNACCILLYVPFRYLYALFLHQEYR